jgi:hypothetical protein
MRHTADQTFYRRLTSLSREINSLCSRAVWSANDFDSARVLLHQAQRIDAPYDLQSRLESRLQLRPESGRILTNGSSHARISAMCSFNRIFK